MYRERRGPAEEGELRMVRLALWDLTSRYHSIVPGWTMTTASGRPNLSFARLGTRAPPFPDPDSRKNVDRRAAHAIADPLCKGQCSASLSKPLAADGEMRLYVT